MSEQPPFDPAAMFAHVVKVGDEWADTKAAYEALDDMTKTVLADVTADYLPQESSRAAAEMRALGSKVYKEHLAAVASARRAFLRAQVSYEGAKMLAGLRQTQESTRRAEMRL